MSDNYAPIKGKCMYWRECLNEDDRFDSRVKKADKRIECSCFVEGRIWPATAKTLLADCPERYHCRYYVKQG
jgi:hypothetical protein